MNLSGKVFKTFHVEVGDRTINWDGRDENGNFLLTGIYLITSFVSNSNSNNSAVAKLAVIY